MIVLETHGNKPRIIVNKCFVFMNNEHWKQFSDRKSITKTKVIILIILINIFLIIEHKYTFVFT